MKTLVSLLTCLAGWLVIYPAAAGATSAAPLIITIDGRGEGRTFDGIGGLSAGASSRLLFDYPEPERSQILDYLFKPNYGASLQILKVEIGGDSDSTAGSEAGHMRTPTDLNGGRGYEWWLMKEAKKRNPDIKLWGLEWCTPSWFKGGFWSHDNIEYLLAWLHLARQQGLKIDYMGGHNEGRGYDIPWYIAWHAALAQQFPEIRIVGVDDFRQPWGVVDAMLTNADFRAAIDIVGGHGPCHQRSDYTNCTVTPQALQIGKKLWDSEQSAQGHDVGAIPWARALNRTYIDGRVTANVCWSLISAYYSDLSLADTGLMLADRPWSGYYHVGKSLWVFAHTAQFTRIGWQYIDNACGYLPGGSYVTLKSPDGRDFTTVIETTDATEPQVIRLKLIGAFGTRAAQVWSTDLTSNDPKDYFVHELTIKPEDGGFAVTLQPHHLYTISTTTSQSRGAARPKARPDEQMPLPYHEDFEFCAGPGKLARYFSDIEDTFETAPCGGGRTGMCYRQVLTAKPLGWGGGKQAPPTTVMGDPRWWGDYEVSVDVLLEQEGFVELMGRVSTVRGVTNAGYHLQVSSRGRWTLYSEDIGESRTNLLASGDIGFNVGSWHRLGLRMLGNQIEVLFDGQLLGKVLDDRHLTGQIGFRVSSMQNAEFDNVSITKTGPWPHFVPHAQMKATATSEHPDNTGGYDYKAANAIDDRPETTWGAEWNPPSSLPQSITLDLSRTETVRRLLCQPNLPRGAGAGKMLGKNKLGYITSYRICLSRDGKTFTEAAKGAWPATGSTKLASWPPQKARYVRLEALASSGGLPMVGEICVTKD